MNIIGISAFYHDSAAALIVDGDIVAAAQEERFTRKKHDANFPLNAMRYCLTQGGLTAGDIDAVVFYEKPFIKFERLLETYVNFAPSGFSSFKLAMPLWLKEKLFQKKMLAEDLEKVDDQVDWDKKLLFSEHHLSHAASAFYPSPFHDAVVLTLDGVGEWATSSVCFGKDADLEIDRELHFPHSLGLLYSAFTYYTGFKVNSGEYKLMGLAPYGQPKYRDLILDRLVDVRDDGTFTLDQSYFDYAVGLKMTNSRFEQLFGEPARKPESELLTQFHMDVAASIQAVTEEIMIRLTRSLAREGFSENLCLAGGVALNCVANGEVLRDNQFKRLWIQPAAGDAGGAVGAALAAWHKHFKGHRAVRSRDAMRGSLLGPAFTTDEAAARLAQAKAKLHRFDDDALLDVVSAALAEGKAVAWFHGRMEFGPRALGGRSILGDPRSPTMQKTLNLRVKYRESFRPFAPSVLAEDAAAWFELESESPYMLLVADVRSEHRREMTTAEQALFGIDKLNVARSSIPAVTHVDYSARVQTVHADTQPRYHALLERFKARTGCPVLINTSFNVRGEPIVCTPEDAFRCFMGSDIEMLVVENCVLHKDEQDPSLKLDYSSAFELD